MEPAKTSGDDKWFFRSNWVCLLYYLFPRFLAGLAEEQLLIE